MELGGYWKDICKAIQEGVFVVDCSGHIVMANEAMAQLTGFSREELLGKSCKIFECDACEQYRLDCKDNWCGLFAGEPVKAKRCLIVRKDGLRVPVFKNQGVLKGQDGAIIGAVESVVDLSELDRLDKKVEELSRILVQPGIFHGMVGRSEPMRRLFDLLEKAARSEAPVLLLGETGTGKELAAHALHALGNRKNGPFVQLNCASFNESLLESELFGHAKGAFTGAYRTRRGRFEEAHGGDIFLDEIGDAPLSIQTKLLRVLETKSVERMGESRPIAADARLIAATRQDLPALIARGAFREDFYFRINAIPIVLPPLRKRLEDLPLLVDHFLHLVANRFGKRMPGISPEVMSIFGGYDWPGNVRQLRSALEYAVMLESEGRVEPEHLPPGLGGLQCFQPNAAISEKGPESERAALVKALQETAGNKSKAARILGVTRLTVHNRIRKYGIVLGSLGRG